jgi:hypothetical protein
LAEPVDDACCVLDAADVAAPDGLETVLDAIDGSDCRV